MTDEPAGASGTHEAKAPGMAPAAIGRPLWNPDEQRDVGPAGPIAALSVSVASCANGKAHPVESPARAQRWEGHRVECMQSPRRDQGEHP